MLNNTGTDSATATTTYTLPKPAQVAVIQCSPVHPTLPVLFKATVPNLGVISHKKNYVFWISLNGRDSSRFSMLPLLIGRYNLMGLLIFFLSAAVVQRTQKWQVLSAPLSVGPEKIPTLPKRGRILEPLF